MSRLWAALLVAALLGCSGSNTADERLRAYLGLAPSVELNTQSARDAFLRKIPLGTPAREVEKRLSDAGIGKDKLSSYERPDEKGVAWVRIDFDPTTLGFAKTSYGIQLRFNPEKRLASVEVRKWVEGV